MINKMEIKNFKLQNSKQTKIIINSNQLNKLKKKINKNQMKKQTIIIY